jgi:hypothetical protein
LISVFILVWMEEAQAALATGEGLLAAGVEVARADDRGRLVRARAPDGVAAGEVAGAADVFVWSFMPREAKRLCAHCGRRLTPSAGPPRRCRSGCAHTWYCPPPPPLPPEAAEAASPDSESSASACEQEGDKYHGGAGCRSMRRYDAAVATGLRKGTLARSLFGSQEATMLARLVIGAFAHPDRRQRALTLALEPNTHGLSPVRLAQYEVCLHHTALVASSRTHARVRVRCT